MTQGHPKSSVGWLIHARSLYNIMIVILMKQAGHFGETGWEGYTLSGLGGIVDVSWKRSVGSWQVHIGSDGTQIPIHVM